jgi:hypothetical protein
MAVPERGRVDNLHASITALASVCREALEQMSMRQRGVALMQFPRGACGAATELMGRLVFEATNMTGLYLCGIGHPDMPQQTHGWLELGGLLVDLTHDQFSGTGLVGWVFEASPWHAKFETNKHPVWLDVEQPFDDNRTAYAVIRRAAEMNRLLCTG